MSTIEGSLDILWENHQQAAAPRYRLIFARYKNFRSGAQPSKKVVGDDALESYLVQIGFAASDAKLWIKQLQEKQSVSIPNVMMPEAEMSPYELSA